MAPPQPQGCSTPGCKFQSAPKIRTITDALQHLQIHVNKAHPLPAAGAAMPSSTKVSFLEETVYNVTLAGLRDQDMQERCLAAAYMKTIGNVTELVKFCSADKASRIPGSRTIGGLLTSSFQQGKKERVVRQQKPRQPSLGSPPPAAAAGSLRCLSCSGACRNRATKCRACNVTCRACQRPGHLDNVCPSSRAPGYASRNAALASETPEKPESE